MNTLGPWVWLFAVGVVGLYIGIRMWVTYIKHKDE
jgi:hypothetical protein